MEKKVLQYLLHAHCTEHGYNLENIVNNVKRNKLNTNE